MLYINGYLIAPAITVVELPGNACSCNAILLGKISFPTIVIELLMDTGPVIMDRSVDVANLRVSELSWVSIVLRVLIMMFTWQGGTQK